MTYLESLFRKLRFDVETIKTNVGVMDKFLSFRPDLVIMTARGKKINGLELCKKMNPKGDATKIVLAMSTQSGIKPTELKGINIVGFLESPINPGKALELIAQHLKLDLSVLKENMERAGKTVEEAPTVKDSTFVKSKERAEEATTWVKGKGNKDSIFEASGESAAKESLFEVKGGTAASSGGESKYLNHKLLNFELPKQRNLDKERIQKAVAKIATEGEEPDLDQARQDFVRALYKR